jgi:hypothetical protein
MLHRSSVVCDNTGLCYQYKINKPTRRKPMNRPLFGKSCQARCQGWTKLSSIICLAHGLRLGRIDMYNAHDVWSQSVTALSISVRSAPPRFALREQNTWQHYDNAASLSQRDARAEISNPKSGRQTAGVKIYAHSTLCASVQAAGRMQRQEDGAEH